MKPKGPTARTIIKSMRNRRLGWATAIGELIDNSAGNGAKTVTIRFTPNRACIIDDGVGCDEAKFAALASIGWHQEDDLVQNSVSRFGIGAKDAFIWAGGPTELYSRRGGTARALRVDWDDFGRDWTYEEPETGVAAEKGCDSIGLFGDGTAIVMPRHSRQMHRSVFEDLQRSLNQTHWAAVETGVIIRLEFKGRGQRKWRGGPLPGKAMPEFIDGESIDTEASLSDGRCVRIHGGVLSPSVRMSDPGFEYIYGHRVVIPACGLGAGSMDFERVYFRIYLAGDKCDWRVTTNKCGLHDADEAAVAEIVHATCRNFLERSKSESLMHLEDQELFGEVSELVNEASRKRGKRRSPQNHTGRVAPTGRGGKHRNASQTQDGDGDVQQTKKSGTIDIVPSEFEEKEAHLVGKAVVRDRKVRLNVRHECVAKAKADRNKSLLACMAFGLWSDAWISQDDDGQRRYVHRMTFPEKFSAMLTVIQEQGTAKT